FRLLEATSGKPLSNVPKKPRDISRGACMTANFVKQAAPANVSTRGRVWAGNASGQCPKRNRGLNIRCGNALLERGIAAKKRKRHKKGRSCYGGLKQSCKGLRRYTSNLFFAFLSVFAAILNFLAHAGPTYFDCYSVVQSGTLLG